MKKMLIFPLTAVLVLSMLTGCNRNLRRDQTPQESTQPVLQATDVIPPTSAPVLEATAIQNLPTEAATTQPTATLPPTLGVSESDIIANQLNSLLGQFDIQLQSVDTIPENP